jgi:hypothetical protein
MPDKLSRLTGIGFSPAGKWKLTDGTLSFEIEPRFAALRNVLYAFAVDGALVYIGKTTVALRDRLQRYKTPAKSAEKGGSTNIKNNRNILTQLTAGRSVDIHVLYKESVEEHGGFVVNFAAGLEDGLLASLTPPWNGRDREVVTRAPVVSRAKEFTPEIGAATSALTRLTAADFHTTLCSLLSEASSSQDSYIDIQAGQLHRRVGKYPGPDHSMPTCCSVMRSAMRDGDSVLAQPPKGKGASLTIRYRLPR